MEPTSEQELKQLLDEDKISQAEYEQLLEAMETKHLSGSRIVHPKGSQKQAMIAAILFTTVTALLLWICLMCIDKPALRNKSIVIGVCVVCVIGSGIQALRYWVAFWTYKEISS
jgi:hypothetical protein